MMEEVWEQFTYTVQDWGDHSAAKVAPRRLQTTDPQVFADHRSPLPTVDINELHKLAEAAKLEVDAAAARVGGLQQDLASRHRPLLLWILIALVLAFDYGGWLQFFNGQMEFAMAYSIAFAALALIGICFFVHAIDEELIADMGFSFKAKCLTLGYIALSFAVVFLRAFAHPDPNASLAYNVSVGVLMACVTMLPPWLVTRALREVRGNAGAFHGLSIADKAYREALRKYRALQQRILVYQRAVERQVRLRKYFIFYSKLHIRKTS